MNVDLLPVTPGSFPRKWLTETSLKSIATCNNCSTPASDPSLVELLGEMQSRKGSIRLTFQEMREKDSQLVNHASEFERVLRAGCVYSAVAAKMFDGKVQQLPEMIVCGFGDHPRDDEALRTISPGPCDHVGAPHDPFCLS